MLLLPVVLSLPPPHFASGYGSDYRCQLTAQVWLVTAIRNMTFANQNVEQIAVKSSRAVEQSRPYVTYMSAIIENVISYYRVVPQVMKDGA